MNSIKTFVLMGLLTALLVYLGGVFGGKGGMVLAFLFAVVMNFGTYWFSDRVVLRMYKATEIGQDHRLYRLVEDLAGRGGIPMPRVYVIPSAQPNAFATGRDPHHAAVAVTEGILQTLSDEELRGVIGHELSHVRHRDILIGTVAATIGGAISMMAQIAQFALIFGGGRGNDNRDGNPLAALVAMILAPIVALMIQMAISRSREFLADEGGAKLAGNPLSLANALRKLDAAAKRLPMEASPATAHMFIVSPLRGGGLSKLFSTHPPMEERVARLEAMVYGTTAG